MQDVAEGGGAPVATVIADGASNAIFDDISELDRAGGRVSLRKAHVTVQTPTTDGFFGTNVIVAEPPQDPRVSVTLFSTKATFDRRTDAQSRVESYLAPGSTWAGYLLENHVAGQRAMQLFQRVGSELPPVGKTLLLISGEGTALVKSQYVRVTKATAMERTFTFVSGSVYTDYKALVVTCDLSDPLRSDFHGSPPSRLFERDRSNESSNPTTVVKDTVVADAATYYGVVPLAAPVVLGGLSARVSSIYTQLVPSARAEIPVADARAGMVMPNITAVTTTPVTISTALSLPVGGSVVRHIGHAAARSSVAVSLDTTTLTDQGDGTLDSAGGFSGTIDYATGTLTLNNTGTSWNGVLSITALPAAVLNGQTYTAAVPVTLATRAYNYLRTLRPSPAPGTVSVDYLVLGKWYRLTDDGSGRLRAGSSEGSGTVNYATGTVSATLGALPDVDSRILWSWGSADTGHPGSFSTDVTPPVAIVDLNVRGIEPGSVTVTYTAGGVSKTLTDSAGVLSGDGDGWVLYGAGRLGIRPNVLPDPTNLSVSFIAGGELTHAANVTPNSAGTVEFDLPGAPIRPRSLTLEFRVMGERTAQQATVVAVDEGNGVLLRVKDDGTATTLGGIDYVSGHITLSTRLEGVVWRQFSGSESTTSNRSSTSSTSSQPGTQPRNTYEYIWQDGRYVLQPYTTQVYAPQTSTQGQQQNQVGNSGQSAWQQIPEVLTLAGPVTARYRAANDSVGAVQTISVSPPPLRLQIKADASRQVLPGSLRFTLGPRVYVDREGVLYHSIDPLTNAGTVAGSVDYAGGVLTVADWPAGVAPVVTGTLALARGDFRPDMLVFRAPATNLLPGSVQVRALDATTSEAIVVEADLDGYFSGSATGRVEHATGIIELAFGSLVVAADVPEAEREPWWYDSRVITPDGDIWRPRRIIADSVRFNCVATSYIPLDADILGIDPVRLPPDGRVPVFRVGGFAVLGHTARAGPHTVSTGQTIDVGRVRLSRLRVVGSDAATITAGYTQDLDAGTVTFTDTTGYAQPVTLEHRIEDMAVVSDVQINGQLTFTRQITHDYPLGSYIASALVVGDLRARVSVLFDQQTWDATWVDTVKGSAAVATYNDTLHPIAVTNIGAVTERWLVRFTNTTTLEVIGEHVGVIALGNTSADLAPLNPATGAPYFSLPAAGWGLGWSAGNVLRFNTIGAQFPLWLVRTIQQGPETVTDDAFTVLIRGDVDQP